MKIPKHEERTLERLKAHYLVEKELADRLRRSSSLERRQLYSQVYDELFNRVSDHPQLTRKMDGNLSRLLVDRQIKFLKNYLRPEDVFLEVGPGDCNLSFEVAKYVKKVYAVDVSTEITAFNETPVNFELIISDGCSIPVPTASVSLAYSNQLMEHLHPDDAIEQLRNIYDVLTSGGMYICVTPNRLSGPHDVSKYFDLTATGFHLREYTFCELEKLMSDVGFSGYKVLAGGRGIYFQVPRWLTKNCERIIEKLPFHLKRLMTANLPFKPLLNMINIVAVK